MTIQPFGNNILIEPIEEKTLILAEKRTLCEYGEVKAIGSDVKHIKVGNKVGFVIWGLNALNINGKSHYFVQENSDFILGIIEDESVGKE